MGKRLAIILGAGASHDLTGPSPEMFRGEFRPPLTKDIFTSSRDEFQAILEQYPDALTLAATIRHRIRTEPLEAILRSLHDSTEEHIARQFRQVPLYLQHLFGEISKLYTPDPENYTYLVSQVLGSAFEKVAFVTLNYDLLLEQAIEAVTAASISDLRAYVEPAQKWMLVKLHGSVNWAIRVVGGMEGALATPEGVLSVVGALAVGQAIDGQLEVIDDYSDRWDVEKARPRDLLYPAIAVPVEDKYEYVCPADHLDELRAFLGDCENFLFIGVSGRDKDLLELLCDSVKVGRETTIVSWSDPGKVYRRIQAEVPQLFRRGDNSLEGGFSQFISSGALDDFLRNRIG